MKEQRKTIREERGDAFELMLCAAL